MGHQGNGPRASEPQLDQALARAIRQLIAEAVESSGTGEAAPDSDSAAA